MPVVLLGTFGIMSAFGFTINILTMFGLVLAIGLLVDDAIVVVENVESASGWCCPLYLYRWRFRRFPGVFIVSSR
ncbi:Hypothetical protein ABZS17H1_02302 [Kosakonia cowanii]